MNLWTLENNWIDSNIAEQWLTDQRRFITRNKIFRNAELEDIPKNCENGILTNNSRIIGEIQVTTIANIKEAADMYYINNNLEDVITT